MESCRAVRIWGLGQHRRNKPACRFAVCPSTVAASSFTSLRPTERNTALEKELEIALTQREVPVDDLAGVERSKRSAGERSAGQFGKRASFTRSVKEGG